MRGIFNYFTLSIIPIIILLVVCYGIKKKVKIYECFVEGAKEGLYISLRIFPYLLAMLIAVSLFRESGALDYFTNIFRPIVKIIGLPEEVVPLIFIKPLSGSGGLGVYTEIVKKYGTDSFIGMVSSIIMNSTETIFYTISVYFGAIGIKKIRHTIWAALIAELSAIIIAVNIAKLFF